MTDDTAPASPSPAARRPTPIDAIAEEWVTTLADLVPTLGTYIGVDTGRGGEWEDLSPAGHDALLDAARGVRRRLEAEPATDAVDRATRDDLLSELEVQERKHALGFHLRDLNVIASPLQNVREVFDIMPTDGEEDWSRIASRLRGLPAALDGYAETLRLGVERGVVPARRQVVEGVAQARDAADPAGVFADLVAGARDVPAALVADLEAGATASARAYGELAGFLERELLPAGGDDDAVGREIYEVASRSFLGSTIDLDETYAWGIEELRRMTEEQESIAREIVPGGTIADAIAHLDGDASRKLHGTDELRAWMQETSDRAVEELGRTHFDIPAEVRTLECRIAPSRTGAIYYTGPTDDFSRPGRMWWSVAEGVTEFDTWRELTTVYHEGVPGHHLQIGQAVYNRATLNAYRRLLAGTSGHAEGWALYAERLMQELGYLDDPADRLGMLDGQRMRAARVVLDLGVHLRLPLPDGSGTWTGDHAFDFLAANVNMPAEFVRFEANRYLGWPGQAPSYKVGQRIWEELRDETRRRQGAAFDPKAFHTRALDLGGVGLDTLRTALLD